MIELELPYPPSINHYYRRVNNKTLISREGRTYRSNVGAILATMGIPEMEGNLCVEIEAFPPDRRRRDADNLLKSCLDSLQHGGLYHDDFQIKDLRIVMKTPIKGGAIILRISEIENV